MLLKNYCCFTTEDFEGDVIRFDLPNVPKVSGDQPLHITCENTKYVLPLMHIQLSSKYSYPRYSWIIFFLCGNENVLPSLFVIYEWPNVDWITTLCNYINIQFQGYFIHRYFKTLMFKIIHTHAHRFPLVVDRISFVFYTAAIRYLYVATSFLHISCGRLACSSLAKDSSGVKLVDFMTIIWAFKSCYKFSMGFRPRLWLCHSRTLISFSMNDFWTTLAACFGSLC